MKINNWTGIRRGENLQENSRNVSAGSPVGIQLGVTPGSGEAGRVGGNGRVIATH